MKTVATIGRMLILCLLIYCWKGALLHSQTPGINEQLKLWVTSFKKDDRGPYQAIRWFCPDGTLVTPPARCPQNGGIMHALPKDQVAELAKTHNIHLGQILAGTAIEDFWDAGAQHSRLKQYQLEKFLYTEDNGWILRRARFYRGAFQAEDEEKWGKIFLADRLARQETNDAYFFLLREAAKDLPHRAANDKRWDAVRSNSKTLADAMPEFFNLRVKLHGQPEPSDLPAVKEFKTKYKDKLDAAATLLLDQLIADLEIVFQEVQVKSLTQFLNRIPDSLPFNAALKKIIAGHEAQINREIADLMWTIRTHLSTPVNPAVRLVLLDLSIALENVLFLRANSLQPQTIGALLEKNYVLAKAAAACGFLEIWEWETVEPILNPDTQDSSFAHFFQKADYARRLVNWGTAMFRAEYIETVSLFGSFEPLAYGFTDARIRSSVLLPLGNTSEKLWHVVNKVMGSSNEVMSLKNQTQIRGLNPGFAVGELVVVNDSTKSIDWSPGKIYVMQQAPADLKPVAGIMAVTEGNLVSHVQLLARNLGIPNASLSPQDVTRLQPFSGSVVFYAVSPGGVVVMKPLDRLNVAEKALTAEKKRPEEQITVPIQQVDWNAGLKRLSQLRAVDSGVICGPKAANLAQLKFLFPRHVVEGLVIPFAVFRKHMNQNMPGTQQTYWEFLSGTFEQARQERRLGKSDAECETFILARLALLRKAIGEMSFLPGFAQALSEEFQNTFAAPMGQQPVFVRSDTNMEDLKDFTGAGLNLTVFNVLETAKILQSIRDVWASPYSERSYLWRQKYLLNPEHVYPSILLLPSVNVDKSGVMITSGVTTDDKDDLTIAFSRGAGGAVEGQAAESYVIGRTQRLLTPAREMRYTTLPLSGGTEKLYTRLNLPLLSSQDLKRLRQLAQMIKTKLTEIPGTQSRGPLDIELGFKDGKIWLFQVRPYVENKKAGSSMYLKSLDPALPSGVTISADDKLPPDAL